jgi:hypothetical protein
VSEKRRSLLLEVPRDKSFLGLVREVAKKMAETAGFSAPVADDVSEAVDEAAAGALAEAPGGPDRPLELGFEDQGPEFCVDVPGSGPAPANGRLRQVMDSVTVQPGAGQKVCCLVKRKVGDPRTP